MSQTRCPKDAELVQLLDKELAENQAALFRNHISVCSRCQREMAQLEQLRSDLRSPVPGVGRSQSVDRIMAKLDSSATEEPVRIHRFSLYFAVGSTCAIGVLLVLWVAANFNTGPNGSEFQSRGSSEKGSSLEQLDKKVGLEIYTLNKSPEKIESGMTVAPDATWVAAYNNLLSTDAYLLLFVMDQKNETHWLYPAYLDSSSNPESVVLSPVAGKRFFSESIVLERPAPGAARVVGIVGLEPLSVATIESIGKEKLSPDKLKERFPNFSIRLWSVVLSTQ